MNAVDPTDSRATEHRVLDHLNTAVLLFGRDLRLRYVNAAAEVMFALSARHLIGQPLSTLFLTANGRIEKVLRKALDAGQPFTERERVVPLADGREITIDCTVVPLRDGAEVAEVLVEIQQIDRQLRINREEQLLAQHEAARALVKGLAHEIKNPLGGLRGAAQLLERELPDQGLCEYTQVIIHEADRLQVLVDKMLGPNRLLELEEVNIHEVLERVRSLVSAESGGGLVIDRDYDPSIPSLWGDRDRLVQAFLNIVRNAAQAAGHNGRVEIRTRVLRQFTIGNQRHRLVLQVDVQDNGPGVPAELQEKIFYPMVSGSEGGTGLGLTIAQSMINLHRGLIECVSKPGQTVFTVLIPLERQENG